MPDHENNPALDNAIEQVYMQYAGKLTSEELDKKIEEVKKSFAPWTNKPAVTSTPVVMTPVIKPDFFTATFSPDNSSRDRDVEEVYTKVGNTAPAATLKATADRVQSVYDSNRPLATQAVDSVKTTINPWVHKTLQALGIR